MNLLRIFRFPKVPHAGNSVLALSMLFGLVACTASGYPDLESYVKGVKARPGGRIEPVPEVKSYPSFPYGTTAMRSPFKSDSEGTVNEGGEAREKPPRVGGNNREPLEGFPLDTLKLVGYVGREGETFAVITAPDGLVYKVQVGNYLGQNDGRISRITEDKVLLIEQIPAPNGGWIEREASLALVE